MKTDFQNGKRFPAADDFQREPQQISSQKFGQRFPLDWKKQHHPGGAFLLPFQSLLPCTHDLHFCESAHQKQRLVLGWRLIAKWGADAWVSGKTGLRHQRIVLFEEHSVMKKTGFARQIWRLAWEMDDDLSAMGWPENAVVHQSQ